MDEKQLSPVICVLNPDDIKFLKEENAENVDSFKTPFEIMELKEQGYNFPDIKEGRAYMRDPFDKKKFIYRMPIDDEKAIEKRISIIEQIIYFLGGKKLIIQVKTEEVTDQSSHVSHEAGGSSSSININEKGNIGQQSHEGRTKDVSLATKWVGPKPMTKESYEEAERIAKEYGLFNDTDINNFFVMRKPGAFRRMEDKTYHVHTHQDLTRNLEIAQKIDATLKVAKIKLDVNYERSKSEAKSETYDFNVEFEPYEMNEEPEQIPTVSVPKTENISTIENKKEKSNKWLFWVMGGVIAALAAGLLIALL